MIAAVVGGLGQLDDDAGRVLGLVGPVKTSTARAWLLCRRGWGKAQYGGAGCGWRISGSRMAVPLVKNCLFIQYSTVTHP